MKIIKLFIAAIICSLSSSVFAATIYWGNPGEGLWSTPANWGGGLLPNNEDARINNGGTVIIDASQNIVSLFAIMADTNGTTGTLRVTGGSLTAGSDIRVGGTSATTAGGTGTFDQSGGTIVTTGNLNLGFGTNAVGTYNISGGSLQLNTATPIFAVGNRGRGTVNQSGGTIFLRAGTGYTQLGRNAAAGTGFGTYNLSGGTLATPRLSFGAAIGTPISTNIFNLSGTGQLIASGIFVTNTTASNYFNFTGGTLTVMTNSLALTNSGGTLSPATIDFVSGAGTNFASLPINPIGTNVFVGVRYVQEATGTLAIDIGGPGNNDLLNITPGPALAGATIAGTISVRLLNGYNPPLGTTFDVVSADAISNTAIVTGNLGSGFSASVVGGGGSPYILRLTVTNQPAVAPKLTGATILGSGAFKFSFTNNPNFTFTVLGATNIALPGTSWSVLGSATETSPGQYEYTDSGASGFPLRFYKVRWP